MALIKGSRVDQAGSVVVQGDKVMALDSKLEANPITPSQPTIERSKRAGAVGQLEQRVPELSAPPVPATQQPAVEGDSDSAPADTPEPAAAPAPEARTPDDLLDDWDALRDPVLAGARQQAAQDSDLSGLEEGAASAAYESLMQAATDRLGEAMGEQAAQALTALVPALEQQAAVAAELAATRTAARVRWRDLASAEEQLSQLLEVFEFSDHEAISVLAQRERILAQARLDAETLLSNAQQEALQMRYEAQKQAAEIIEDFERTRSERYAALVAEAGAAGYTEGRAQADEEGAKIVEEAIETLNRARLAYPQAVRENSSKLIKLAIGVAERIIQNELTTKPDTVLQILEGALTKVTDLEAVIIRVNPEDLPLVQAQEEKFQELLSQVKKLEFASSNKIQRGGVYIETASGTVDATIKTQLSVMSEVFANVLKELEDSDAAANEAFEELN